MERKVCTYCGHEGHRASNCPRRPNALQRWLDGRRRMRERDAFSRGYEWGKHALLAGTHTPDALDALADGAFNDSPYHRAYDRGVQQAAAEARHA